MSKLIPATPEDLPKLAAIHKKVYSSAHFTSRFPHQLLKSYYGSFLGPQCFIIKSLRDEENSNYINGFVVCGVDIPDRIKKFKKNNRFSICWTALLHPLAASRKIVEQAYHCLFDSVVPFQQCPFLVLSIASDRSAPGIGVSLLEYAKKISQSSGFDVIGLYVRVNNIKAISFYLNNGFAIVGYGSGQFYMEAKTCIGSDGSYASGKTILRPSGRS